MHVACMYKNNATAERKRQTAEDGMRLFDQSAELEMLLHLHVDPFINEYSRLYPTFVKGKMHL